jgi:hypothetical protein
MSEILIVTRGTRVGAKNKKFMAIQEVTPDEYASGADPKAPIRLFAYNALRKHFNANAGCVYRVEAPDTSTIKPGTAIYDGGWPDHERRAAWAAESRAEERQQQAKSFVLKAEKFDPLKEQLAPIRHQYHRLIGSARAQLLAAVVEAIVS